VAEKSGGDEIFISSTLSGTTGEGNGANCRQIPALTSGKLTCYAQCRGSSGMINAITDQIRREDSGMAVRETWQNPGESRFIGCPETRGRPECRTCWRLPGGG